jgi:hypothetical protein
MYVRGMGQATDPGCVVSGTDSAGNLIESCNVSTAGSLCGGVSTYPFFGVADASGFCTALPASTVTMVTVGLAVAAAVLLLGGKR